MTVLGECYRESEGAPIHTELLKIRAEMVALRDAQIDDEIKALRLLRRRLEKKSAVDRKKLAHGFSLLMEVMNSCENAYRAYYYRNKRREIRIPEGNKITWVLTAHPTESRTAEIVPLLQDLQTELANSLMTSWEERKGEIQTLMSMIVRTAIAPEKKPEPKDEAAYLYQIVLKKGWLDLLLAREDLSKSFRLRSWVGGDKDGHPGVDERAFLASLTLSRGRILDYLQIQIREWTRVQKSLALKNNKIPFTEADLKALRKIRKGDYRRVLKLKKAIDSRKDVGKAVQPFHQRISRLFEVFPALVIPLEFREASDELQACIDSKTPKKFAFYRMLQALSDLSEKDSPHHYVQACIISMCQRKEDLQNMLALQKKVLRTLDIPVIPLFETAEALVAGPTIIQEFWDDTPEYQKAVKNNFSGNLEIMLGYSDSSKLAGVLYSRVHIRTAMNEIEDKCIEMGVTPVFFHGSGGSIARGGGNLHEQTQGWSEAALSHYKATLQGEMVSRTFSEPEIFLSQIETIAEVQSRPIHHEKTIAPEIIKWAEGAKAAYLATVRDPEFLNFVQRVTLYPYLHELKFGSRPSKRKSLGGVQDLRAIPWILCWTQSRVLFPTWWGLSEGFQTLTDSEQKKIHRLFMAGDPILQAFVKQLGYTLQKISLPVFFENLSEKKESEKIRKQWTQAFQATQEVFQKISGETNLLWFRPWLKESIYLRSPLIHPLNILQQISIENKEMDLLRLTVTGVASGMLNTG
jgi:phosphoenolpyruvate carboxylase